MFSQLGDKLQDIFKDLRGHGTISESNINDALRQVRLALLEADVDFKVAKNFVARVKEKALGEEQNRIEEKIRSCRCYDSSLADHRFE
ncbi:MAG: hypothetical protein DME32_12500 [Verrucomicrobia bacterium]|nr:MAG: hypothetical protein DME32_12500 [Verrucomicrobiota bacterium]